MRCLPSGLVVHRWCVRARTEDLRPIGPPGEGGISTLARPETVASYERMSQAARSAGVQLHVVWAFRDPGLQKSQFEEAKRKHGPRNGIRWLAPPGFSEHQTGWVLDIGDADDRAGDDNPLFERTKAFRWLRDNARAFQFELSFPPGNWQGVSYEPWHWRFVGTPEARQTFHPQGLRAVAVWGRSLAEALRWWLHPGKS